MTRHIPRRHLAGVALTLGALAVGPLSGSAMAQSPTTSEVDTLVGPDEEWVVYQWGSPDGGEGIFLVRPDGTGGHELAEDAGGSRTFPTWSPDGDRIAFRKNDTQLWVVDADGTDAQLVHDCAPVCNTLNYPDWAPDGAAIYFGFDANGPAGGLPTTFGVRRIDLGSGSVSEVLVREDGMTAEQPRLSPDGSQVAYTRYSPIMGSTGSAIFVSDLAGGEERQLTDWDLWAAYPDWGPDGIVFNTRNLSEFQDTTEPANLYTVAPDGSDLRQLTTFSDHDTRATQPRWTPDGSGITFTKIDGEGYGVRLLARLGADGDGMRLLTPEPGTEGTHPELRPIP